MASKLLLTIESEAQKEIDDAIDWYESQQPGLVLDFFNYLDGYFQTLKEGNVLFPIKRKSIFRELALKRFPYVIIYEHTEAEIVVYSVFNTHQDPVKKSK